MARQCRPLVAAWHGHLTTNQIGRQSGSRSFCASAQRHAAIEEAISPKPKGHDSVIDRRQTKAWIAKDYARVQLGRRIHKQAKDLPGRQPSKHLAPPAGATNAADWDGHHIGARRR
jgi:hypothetical protein